MLAGLAPVFAQSNVSGGTAGGSPTGPAVGCTSDGVNPTRCPNGINTAVNGDYEEYTVDTGGVTAGLALCATSNVDAAGRPKVLPCSHVAANPGAGFVGIAKASVAAAGTVVVCWTVNCSATFDNGSTALNEAIMSVTTDGQLHDTGAQTATAGQPNFSILNANGGSGNSLISLTGMLAQNPKGGGNNGKGGGINSVNSATGPAVTIQGVGSTGVSTSGNTISISGSTTGTIAGTWSNFSGNYTVVDTDNGNRLRFTTSAAAVTLPQPGTISSDPFVAMRAQVNMGGSPPFTSSSFATTAGHQMWISINANGTSTVSSLSLSTGDSCPQQSATTGANASYVYFCPSLVGGGSVTITVNYTLGSASQIGLFAMELVGTTFDNAQTGISPSGFSNISLTNPIHFTNAVAIINQQNGTNLPPSGFVEKDSLLNGNTGSASNRFLSNSNSISTTSLGAISFSQTIASISNHPTFVAGWQVVVENASTGTQTVTSTSSTINGQTTLVLAPNEICNLQSNGANWDAVCGFAPNITFNGAVGSAIQIGYAQNLARNSTLGTTTIVTTGASDAFYTVDADINCTGTTSTGVGTLTITFTDTSNTVQTATANAACTTLGSASLGSIRQAFRAKASTNIQYGISFTGTQSTVDVSVAVNQLSTR
jgi:hypothetical protein